MTTTSEINVFLHPSSQYLNPNTIVLTKDVFGIRDPTIEDS